MALPLPRPLGEGRVRAILAASSGGMRCRRYNYGEAATKPVVVIPSEARNLLFPFPFFVFLPARSHRRATSRRLRAWLRPGPEPDLGARTV